MPLTDCLDEIEAARASRGYGGRFYGAYTALVKDVKDPDGQGRVKVALPWAPDPPPAPKQQSYETWARVATLMGGRNRGSWFIPDVDDEVLLIFLAGDPRHPMVIGGMWNGTDTPPTNMDAAGKNYLKTIRSRNGVKITLDDHDGTEQLVLETPGGQKVSLKDGPGAVWIEDSNGNSIKLESAGITLTAAAKVTVNAGQVAISAGLVTVDAGMSRFSGVVQADTVISNSVISASYTPGAGNIW
jgi:uncharacterized protein involved in type VI secretion and phage assembly